MTIAEVAAVRSSASQAVVLLRVPPTRIETDRVIERGGVELLAQTLPIARNYPAFPERTMSPRW